MRIVYLHQYFTSPDMSGGTRSYEMARRMVQAGHEVHIITSRCDGKYPSNHWVSRMVDGIHVHWLPVRYSNSMSFPRRLIAFCQFAVCASYYAARLPADVIFATSTPLTIAFPAVIAKKRQKIPMVFEVRDLWPELPIAMGALTFPGAKLAGRWLERWAYSHAERVVGLSPGMCEGITSTGYPRSRTVCIPNSCDNDRFDVRDCVGQEFRKKRQWLGDRRLIVYAGTLGRINGVGYLVSIAREMMKLDPEVRFLVVGQGLEKELVERKAKEDGVLNQNFFMEPAVPKDDVPALLNAATVCASLFIPLKPMWNNSANKFFDALSAGRPVLINYEGWQKELLEESSAGFAVPADDPFEAATKLFRFLQNEMAVSRAGRAAKKLATERFSRDALGSNLIQTLEGVVQESHG